MMAFSLAILELAVTGWDCAGFAARACAEIEQVAIHEIGSKSAAEISLEFVTMRIKMLLPQWPSDPDWPMSGYWKRC